MPQQQTIQSFLTWWAETTWNQTPVSPAAVKIPVLGESLKAGQGWQPNQSYRGRYERGKPFRDVFAVGGDLQVALDPLAHGLLLKELLTGTPVTTGANPYTHVLTPGAQTVGFGLERKVGAEYYVYSGLRCVKGVFTAKATGPMAAAFSLIGGGETVATVTKDADPTEYAHDPWELAGTGTQILEGGSAIANVAEVEFTVDREGEAGEPVVGGQAAPSGVLTGFVAISGRVRALYFDKALYDKARAGTESSLNLTLSRGAGTGALGAESLEWVIPELVYEPDAPTIQTAKGYVVEQRFTAYYDNAAEGAGLKATLKNSMATLT